MNKFLVYTLTAILLGSVIMTTPLLLIEPNETLSGTENPQTQDPNTTLNPEPPETQEPEYQTETDRGFAQTTPEDSTESLDQTPAPESPEEPKTTHEAFFAVLRQGTGQKSIQARECFPSDWCAAPRTLNPCDGRAAYAAVAARPDVLF